MIRGKRGDCYPLHLYCWFKKNLRSVRMYQITRNFDHAVNIKLSGEKQQLFACQDTLIRFIFAKKI